jgi:hypothetical protein
MNKCNVATFCNANFQRLDFLSFFQLTKDSKNRTFFVSSESELKPWFPKVHCFWRSFQATNMCRNTGNAQTTYVSFCSANTLHFFLGHGLYDSDIWGSLIAKRTNSSKYLDIYFILCRQLAVYTLWPWCGVPCLDWCYSMIHIQLIR